MEKYSWVQEEETLAFYQAAFFLGFETIPGNASHQGEETTSSIEEIFPLDNSRFFCNFKQKIGACAKRTRPYDCGPLKNL